MYMAPQLEPPSPHVQIIELPSADPSSEASDSLSTNVDLPPGRSGRKTIAGPFEADDEFAASSSGINSPEDSRQMPERSSCDFQPLLPDDSSCDSSSTVQQQPVDSNEHESPVPHVNEHCHHLPQQPDDVPNSSAPHATAQDMISRASSGASAVPLRSIHSLSSHAANSSLQMQAQPQEPLDLPPGLGMPAAEHVHASPIDQPDQSPPCYPVSQQQASPDAESMPSNKCHEATGTGDPPLDWSSELPPASASDSLGQQDAGRQKVRTQEDAVRTVSTRSHPRGGHQHSQRVPLLREQPKSADKAHFDHSSVRLQPFPNRMEPDEIRNICYDFACKIGQVKAVWSGIGTRSGKPYGTNAAPSALAKRTANALKLPMRYCTSKRTAGAELMDIQCCSKSL